jgi:hypothetical protein
MKLSALSMVKKGFTQAEIDELVQAGLMSEDARGYFWTNRPASSWPKRFAPQITKMQTRLRG